MKSVTLNVKNEFGERTVTLRVMYEADNCMRNSSETTDGLRNEKVRHTVNANVIGKMSDQVVQKISK